MKKGGSKRKGSAFERETCVMLSKWLSGGEREDIFWRSSMSGGRATVARKKGKNLSSQVGDVSCIHPMGHKFIEAFTVECKHYTDLNFEGLLTGKGKLIEFWKVLFKQAGEKHRFLIAKQNRLPVYIGLTYDGMKDLGLGMQHALVISRPFDLHLLEAKCFVKVCVPFV